MKTSELTDAALDWATAKAVGFCLMETEGYEYSDEGGRKVYRPSTNWAQGGPIVEREKISVDWDHNEWNASIYGQPCYYSGPTPLVAAMRCYVASKLGNQVEIPEGLM